MTIPASLGEAIDLEDEISGEINGHTAITKRVADFWDCIETNRADFRRVSSVRIRFSRARAALIKGASKAKRRDSFGLPRLF